MNLPTDLMRTGILLSGLLLLASGSTLAQSRLENAIAAAGEHTDNLRFAEADAAYRDLLDRNPDNPAVLTPYGNLKTLSGDYNAAIALAKRAVEQAPDNPGALFQLGVAYRFAGQFATATAVFRRIIGMTPDGPTTAFSALFLADIATAQGNRGQALRQLQVAERLFGETIPDWRLAQLAILYAELGRQDDAQRLFDAMTRTGNATQASLAMGNVAIGDYARALEHARSAVSNPEGGTAIIVLSVLRANLYDDPALAGPVFQEVLSALGHP